MRKSKSAELAGFWEVYFGMTESKEPLWNVSIIGPLIGMIKILGLSGCSVQCDSIDKVL